jgi:NAD(P)-dependent dehydrogenase (short-subunit alcohol dehydrogenase family)
MTCDALADPQFVATVRASIPLGRPSGADEVAKPLIWLLSEGASFITGTASRSRAAASTSRVPNERTRVSCARDGGALADACLVQKTNRRHNAS